MVSLKIVAPPVSAVLASLVLWFSFAWGLTPEVEASEDEGAREGPAATHELNTWLYAGLGLGGHGFAGNAGLNIKHGRYSFTLCATRDGVYLYDSSHTGIGWVFGYYPIQNLGLAGGVAWVETAKFHEAGWFGGYWEYSYTAGIPVEVRYAPVKSRVVGLGLVGHVNFNDKEIFGSITVGIELGKLK